MYALTSQLGGFVESYWLMDKIRLMDAGKVPYRDFEYVLGPVFLYGPILIHWCSHLSLLNSYYLFWIGCMLLGIYLLYVVINRIEYPTAHKRTIFILFSLTMLWAISVTGANYTFCRYIPTALFALIVHKAFSAADSIPGQIKTYIITASLDACLYLISPEMGVSFALGGAIFLAVYMKRKNLPNIASYVSLLLLLSGVSLGANALGMFQALKAYSGGSYNFPILPAPHILLFLLCLLVSACYVVARYRDGSRPDNSIFLIAVFCPAIAAALGRCDPGHVTLSGLGILLAGTFYLSGFRRVWRWYIWAFVIFFVVSPLLGILWLNRNLFTKAIAIDVFGRDGAKVPSRDGLALHLLVVAYGVDNPVEALKDIRARARAYTASSIDFSSLYPGASEVIDVPFGYFPNGIATYHSPRLDEGFYIGLWNVSTDVQTDKKIDELARHSERDLLLPDAFVRACAPIPSVSRRTVSILFAYPFTRWPLHTEKVNAPLCSFISDHYTLAMPADVENFGYGLWKPK